MLFTVNVCMQNKSTPVQSRAHLHISAHTSSPADTEEAVQNTILSKGDLFPVLLELHPPFLINKQREDKAKLLPACSVKVIKPTFGN